MSVMSICKLEQSTWNSKDISLRQKCRELTNKDLRSEWLKSLLVDMFETLYATPSGVGLAAPQVGVQLRIAVIDIKRDAKKPIVLINPSYTGLGNEMIESTESCLSVPGVVGKVMRYEKIKLSYLSISGEIIEKECSGFEAKSFQHEIDHLDGIVYVDRLIDGTNVESADSHVHRKATNSVKYLYEKKAGLTNNE